MLDVSNVAVSNSVSIALVLAKSLQQCDKWSDVIAIRSDSAQYMLKMVNDIHVGEGVSKLLHVTDIAHLIHVAVDTALSCSAMSDARKVVIKFGALF